MKSHPSFLDQAAREDVHNFLATMKMPAPDRVALNLEDLRRSLHFMGSDGLLPSSPSDAQAAASRTFAFSAAALAVFLEDMGTHPYETATRASFWAAGHVERRLSVLPDPLASMLSGTFPEVASWYTSVTVTGIMTPAQAGECAAWWSVASVLTRGVGPYEEGGPEATCAAVLDSLESTAHPKTVN
jgi:hypothetical protein